MDNVKKITFDEKVSKVSFTIINGLNKLIEFLTTILYTSFIGFGVLAIAVVILIAEIHRMTMGIAFFEPDKFFVYITAFGIVLFRFAIDMIIVILERRDKLQEHKIYKWSLRKFVMDLSYFLGFKKLEELDSRALYYKAGNLTTFTMILLAITGTTAPLLPTDVAWFTGIWQVITTSNAEKMLIVVSAVMVTLLLVNAAEVLSRHTAIQALDIIETYKTAQVVIEKKETLTPRQIKVRETRAKNKALKEQEVKSKIVGAEFKKGIGD